MRNRVMIRTIVLMAVAVVFTTAWWLRSGPAAHYRKHKDVESLYATLRTRIQAGDTLAEVQRLLGPGAPEGDQQRMRAAARHFAKLGDTYPDGTEDEDFFVGYEYSEPGSESRNFRLCLQFREGHLVNHIPEEYATFEPFVCTLPQ